MADAKVALEIRGEATDDATAIDALNRKAFGGQEEAEIIARLRNAGLIALSLVADENGKILGHILFSWLPVTIDGRKLSALALAPMAVHPDRQGQGIGSRLVREGLEALAGTQAEAVIVLGHPDFYPRFGFSAALAQKLAAPFAGDAFMALELKPGALQGKSGTVVYPAAFGLES